MRAMNPSEPTARIACGDDDGKQATVAGRLRLRVWTDRNRSPLELSQSIRDRATATTVLVGQRVAARYPPSVVATRDARSSSRPSSRWNWAAYTAPSASRPTNSRDGG